MLPMDAPSEYKTLSMFEPNTILLTLKDHMKLIMNEAISTPKYTLFTRKQKFNETKNTWMNPVPIR